MASTSPRYYPLYDSATGTEQARRHYLQVGPVSATSSVRCILLTPTVLLLMPSSRDRLLALQASHSPLHLHVFVFIDCYRTQKSPIAKSYACAMT